jgi:hypothetical protein
MTYIGLSSLIDLRLDILVIADFKTYSDFELTKPDQGKTGLGTSLETYEFEPAKPGSTINSEKPIYPASDTEELYDQFEPANDESVPINSVIPGKEVAKEDVNNKLWFFPNIKTRQEAEKALFNSHDGTFIIRPAKSENELTLSVTFNSKFKHLKIKIENGNYEFSGMSFTSIEQLVRSVPIL